MIVVVKPEASLELSQLNQSAISVPSKLPGTDVLFYAACNLNKQYTVYGQSACGGDWPQNSQSSQNSQNSSDSSGSWGSSDSSSQDDTAEYCHGRVTPLVRWLNRVASEKLLREDHSFSQDKDGYDYDSLVTDIDNDGVSFTANFPFSLNEACDKCYTLQEEHKINASSSVDVNFKVYPLYMQSCNSGKAGDYYAVTCAITPYNQNMWRS
ncbi:MAG: hypothetical protein Q4F00_02980 [bacterium]|nr:hypothetical protein [bacterium]